MVKKLLFTFCWVLAGFALASVLAAILAQVMPSLGPIDAHTSTPVKLAYAGYALLPFLIIGGCLVLGLLGKLPGTKREHK